MKDRLLVVEDSPTQAEQLASLLEDEYVVELAPTGEDALELISQKQFDLVLSDVVMPGINGFQLVRRIKEDPRSAELPVILLTSLSDPLNIVQGLECGADNYVTKPYDAAPLLLRVRRVLDTSRLRQRTRISSGTHVSFLGRTFTINSDKEQILDLLLSSIEDVLRTNQALENSQRQLAAAHAQLEGYAREKEREARTSTERYRMLMESASDAIIIFDLNGRIVEANLSARGLLGHPVRECRDLNITDLFIEDDPAEFRQQIEDLPTGRSMDKAERKLRRSDGTIIFCEVSASLSSLEGDHLAMAIIRDVTDRKEAARRLQESEQKYRSLFDYNPFAVYSLTARGEFLTANPACEQLTGRSIEELHGTSFVGLLPPQERARVSAHVDKAAEGEAQNYETQIRDRNGRALELTVTNLPFFVDGEIRGVFGIAKDITAWKHAQQKLSESERLLSEAERVARVGSWERDLISGQLTWSAEASRIFDIDPEATISYALLLNRIVAEDRRRIESEITQSLTQMEGFEAECRIQISDGAIRVLRMHSKIEGGLGGKPIRMVGVVQDITRQKETEAALRRSEEQLRQGQKLEAIGRLAGGIAHDFNNLLGVIGGNAQLLEYDLEAGRPTAESIQEIVRATDRAASLSRQLLAFGRQQVLETRPLDLNAVVMEVVALLERVIGEDIRLGASLMPGLTSIQADPGQIHQVLMNFAVNARDAMPNGGALTILTDEIILPDELPEERPLDLKSGSYVRLRVSDTGMGMDDDTQSKIFEPFFTTKEAGHGTGLGLATVYGIVKQSGGSVWVDSALHEGTTFTVLLPCSKDPNPECQSSSFEGGEAHQLCGTVLLVEDKQALRSVIRRILEPTGLTVLEASDGAEALELAALYSHPIDLLLTDVLMPRMNGQELRRRLRPLYPSLKVIYMSGYAEDVAGDDLIEKTAHFIQKPFGPQHLISSIRRAVQSEGDSSRHLSEAPTFQTASR